MTCLTPGIKPPDTAGSAVPAMAPEQEHARGREVQAVHGEEGRKVGGGGGFDARTPLQLVSARMRGDGRRSVDATNGAAQDWISYGVLWFNGPAALRTATHRLFASSNAGGDVVRAWNPHPPPGG